MIVGDPLERESFGKWKKTTTKNIAASSDNQGSIILRPKGGMLLGSRPNAGCIRETHRNGQ